MPALQSARHLLSGGWRHFVDALPLRPAHRCGRRFACLATLPAADCRVESGRWTGIGSPISAACRKRRCGRLSGRAGAHSKSQWQSAQDRSLSGVATASTEWCRLNDKPKRPRIEALNRGRHLLGWHRANFGFRADPPSMSTPHGTAVR